MLTVAITTPLMFNKGRACIGGFITEPRGFSASSNQTQFHILYKARLVLVMGYFFYWNAERGAFQYMDLLHEITHDPAAGVAGSLID